MKTLAALCACLVPLVVFAGDDCGFDQQHQVEVIVAMAKLVPGGSANVADRLVTWAGTEGTTTFGYGGCADLGSVVTRATRMARPRTQEEIFALARELAERFWNNGLVFPSSAAEALLSGLSSARYSRETVGGKTFYTVQDPGYVQLYVEHEYGHGLDRVAIAWQGNF